MNTSTLTFKLIYKPIVVYYFDNMDDRLVIAIFAINVLPTVGLGLLINYLFPNFSVNNYLLYLLVLFVFYFLFSMFFVIVYTALTKNEENVFIEE